jgi:hypothetical protein
MAKKKVSEEFIEDDKVSCPLETINDVINFITKVIDEGGFSKPMTRTTIGILFGKHPNTYTYLLSAGKQYGLLSNEYGNGYFPTDRYNIIVNPIFETDKKVAYYEAINSPELYNTIIQRYNGRSLPELVGFTNLLKGEFKLPETTSEKGVRVFLENAQFVGIIGENRKLRFIMPDADGRTEPIKPTIQQTETEEMNTPPVKDIPKNSTLQNIAKPNEDNMFPLAIQLTGDKVAFLNYPKSITKKDLEIIRIMLNGIEARFNVEEA